MRTQSNELMDRECDRTGDKGYCNQARQRDISVHFGWEGEKCLPFDEGKLRGRVYSYTVQFLLPAVQAHATLTAAEGGGGGLQSIAYEASLD
jgi:hypothetical protein